MSDRDEVRRRMAAKFLAVGRDRVARLAEGVVRHEAEPSDHRLAEELMREIHTLKGEARLVGIIEINHVAHKVEELMLATRRLHASERHLVHDLVLSGLDVLDAMMTKEAGDEGAVVDVESFVAGADRALAAALSPAAPQVPAAAAPDGGEEAVRRFMRLRLDEAIRIDPKRLQAISDSVEDLGLSRGRAGETLDALDALFESLAGTVRAEGRRLVGRLRELDFNDTVHLEGLHDQVQRLRLQPLETLLRRYPRGVRELALEKGKSVRVEIRGADVEMDREILERLSEPLLHLVRNAVDHGLEPPDERTRAGKPETGTIVLEAFARGTRVEIHVADDGRGIEWARVVARAVEGGLVSAEEAAALDDVGRKGVLFTPGFSTADEVSDVSGRGVGLDVVRATLEQLGGSVEVFSERGRGTRFVLLAPMETMLTRALLVESDGVPYALPADGIAEIVDATEDDLAPAGDALALRYRDGLLPAVELRAVLGSGKPAPAAPGGRVVVLRHFQRRLGLRVDGVVGEQAVAQRSAGAFLEACGLVAGTAMLRSGEPAVVLDVSEILRASGERRGAPAQVAAGAAPGATILVVDDSEVTRDLVSAILRGRGHRVITAVNGRAALERIADETPELVITDLEMPVMDGFDFLRAIRGRAELEDLPVLVFTTRGAEADRHRAADLGADAYLLKGELDEADLLERVARFVARAGAA